MISELRKAAARANGAKSRGPKTIEGKRISARNSLKHGLYATPEALLAKSPERLAVYIDAGLAEFHPQTPVAVDLVHAMAAARLLWERSRETETAVITGEMARQAEIDTSAAPNILAARAFKVLADHSRVLDLIFRCEFRYSRRYFIARDLIRRRAGMENENYEIMERTKLPEQVEIKERTKLAHPTAQRGPRPNDILIDSTVDVTAGPGQPPHIRFSQNATHASESSLIQSGFETDLRKGAGS